MGRDPKPTRQARTAGELAVQRLREGNDSLSALVERSGPEVVDGALTRLLLPFLLRDDGWLRITPQEDGKCVYWKWKWTGGKYANHYVMVRYDAADSADALRRLAIKVHAVDSGEQAPVKDHYFKG